MDERARLGALRVASSVAARTLALDPVEAAWLAVRAAPTTLIRPMALAWLRVPSRRPGVVRALAAWVVGGQDAAMDEAGRAESTGTSGARARLAALALACDRPATAMRLLRRLPVRHRSFARLQAGAEWRAGRLRVAVGVLEGAGRGGRPLERARRARLLRSWRSELVVLSGTWHPPPPSANRVRRPVPGRVLHVVTNSLPHTAAGYTLRTQMIGRAQADSGLDPHVVTRAGFPVAQGIPAVAAIDIVDGVAYHRLLPAAGLPSDPADRLDVGARLLGALVERLRPAVLHAATDHHNAQLALAVGERYGLPVVYEVRGFLEESWLSRREVPAAADPATSDRYLMSRAVETACMHRAGAVTTLAAVMAAEIAGRGIDPGHVTVVPNAVAADFLRPAPDPAALRRSLGLGPTDVVVGTITTFYAHEGLRDLLLATRLLADRGAPIRLLLVGDGPERPALERLVAELGLAGRVVLPGRVPHAEVRRYHAALDVFAVPRTGDRVSRMVTPLKPIEAMATRRPVVASDVPALAELVRPGVTGVLAAADDPASLAAAIEPLLYDSGLRTRLGDAAHAWVASDRTWAVNADRYARVYRSLGAQLP